VSTLVGYRACLEPLQAFLTTWQADTLFGAICWALRDLGGTATLETFLAAYEDEQVPLVLSNAFPGDLLPKPLAMRTRFVTAGTRAEQLESARSANEQKRVQYLTPDEFEQFRQGRGVTARPKPAPLIEGDTLHNTIDRRSQSVGESGTLYELPEQFLSKRHRYFTLYLRVSADWVDPVRESLALFETVGVGKRKSLGYGRLKLVEFSQFEFPTHGLPVRGFMSLSNFVPATGDPINGYWRLMVKDGRLDGQWGIRHSNLKKPLLMLQAGSCFETDLVKTWYGRLVYDIHPERPEVVQYGLAYPVPYYGQTKHETLGGE